MTADSVLVIADFEVAKQLGADRESAASVAVTTLVGAAGTLGYMAPEVSPASLWPGPPCLAFFLPWPLLLCPALPRPPAVCKG